MNSFIIMTCREWTLL